MVSGVYIVTGASKGIGLEATRVLLESFDTAGVIAVSRSLTPALHALKDSFASRLLLCEGDVALDDSNAVLQGEQKAVQAAIDNYGKLDGLILNAGLVDPLQRIASLETLAMESVHKLFNVNVLAIFSILRHALPHLRTAKGRVVMISSGAALKASPGMSAYNASKAALNSINGTLAAEEPDITTIALRPGVVSTDMQSLIRSTGSGQLDDAAYQRFVNLHESGQLERPEVPAHIAASLVVRGERDLSGQFVDYAEDKMKGYRKP